MQSTTRVSRKQAGLCLLLVPLLMASVSDCPIADDGPPPNLRCDALAVDIEMPGSCTAFSNPCFCPEGALACEPSEFDHVWRHLDGFLLIDPPAGLISRTERSPTRQRFVCAAHFTTPGVYDVAYRYIRPTGGGEGTMRVTVSGAVLSVEATAMPATIVPDGTSLLFAVARGGSPPYTFSWSPAVALSDPTVPDPFASPATSTTYSVTVTDANGAQASDEVALNVGLEIVVSASAAAIDAGDSSTLDAFVVGGIPPYTFAWTPADTLDDPASSAPTATPTHTTTYEVVVTDSVGVQAVGSISVLVNMRVAATASPATIASGGQAQIHTVVEGGAPPYTFEWSPAASLDDSTARNPIASPTADTTYTVSVRDSLVQTASGSVAVHVEASSVVNADITLLPGPVPQISTIIDASGSTGPIVQYSFWCHWPEVPVPSFPPGPDPVSGACFYELPGEHTLRVEVTDGEGHVDAATVTFVVDLPPARQRNP